MTVPIRAVRQARSYSCGFASALMVLRSFGRSVDGKELFDALGTTRSGTRQGSIVRELRRHQMAANVRYDFDFATLVRSVDAGKLVIAYLGDVEHWLVLFGYETDPRRSYRHRVFVADPRPGEEVEQLWSDYEGRLGCFGIVCSPRRARVPSSSPPMVSGREHPREMPRKVEPRALPPREQLTLPHCDSSDR